MNDLFTLKYLEIFTTCASILSSFLLPIQHMAYWPVSIVVLTLNILIYHDKSFHASSLQNVVCILYSCYGWYQWKYGGKGRTELQVTTRTSLLDGVLLACSALLYLTLSFPILSHLKSTKPLIDLLRSALTFTGMWLTAHKKIEAYLIWGMSNIVAIYLYWDSGLPWFCFKYAFYLLLSVKGFHLWYKKYRAAKH